MGGCGAGPWTASTLGGELAGERGYLARKAREASLVVGRAAAQAWQERHESVSLESELK